MGVKNVGGGGGPQIPSIPIADTTAPVIDKTTYDNTVTGVGKITTLIMPTDTVAFALAVAGDAFPRWLFLSDATDGFYGGDGTFDPYAETGQFVNLWAQGLTFRGIPGAGASINSEDALVLRSGVGTGIQCKGRLVPGLPNSSSGVGASITSNAGDPNGNVEGSAGDIYLRSDGAPGSSNIIYVCTVTGNPGTWVGIL